MSAEHRCETCGQIAPDWAGIMIDPERRTVTRGGSTIRLQRKVFSLFTALYRTPGKPVAKERIHTLLYGNDIDGGPDMKILAVLACKARKKLPAVGLRIDTAWGYGFTLTVEPLA